MNHFEKKVFLLFALFIVTAFFWSCKKTEPVAGKPAAEQVNADGKVDRYRELIRSPEKGRLTIYFLDLSVSPEAVDKSGDAGLILLPDGKVMMVDSGHPESAADSLALLSDLKISRIDYFILSHPHIDHVGGFPAIAEKHEIGEVYQIDMEYPTESYRRYRAALDLHRIPVYMLKRGDTVSFGDEVSAKVYNPPEDFSYPEGNLGSVEPRRRVPAGFPDNSTQFVNDNSLVLKLTWGKTGILLGGDIYLTRERELTELYGDELRSVIAKANHHGLDSSNSIRWIRTVQPRVVVAMNDLFSSMTVYNNFKKNGAAFYHTFLDGLVRVSLDREGNCEVTSRFDSWLRN